MPYVLKNIGYVYFKQGNLNEAISYLVQAEEIATHFGQRETLKEIFQILSEVYESKNHHGKALNYYKLFVETKDSLLNLEVQEKLHTLEVQFEAEKKTRELQHLQSKLNQQEGFFIAIASVGLFFVLIAGVVLIDNRKKRKRNKTLVEVNNSLNSCIDYVSSENTKVSSKINALTIRALTLPQGKDISVNTAHIITCHGNVTILVILLVNSSLISLSHAKLLCKNWVDKLFDKNQNVSPQELQQLLAKN